MATPQATQAPEVPAPGDDEFWAPIKPGGAAHLFRRSQYSSRPELASSFGSPCGKLWRSRRDGAADPTGSAPLCGRCVSFLTKPDLSATCTGCASPLCPDCNVPTETRVLTWLQQYYLTRDRYVLVRQVPDAPGFAGHRTADAVALDMWNSKGLHLHGIEVKVSRSDWLTELRNPEKWRAVGQYMDRWWLAIPDIDIIRGGEVPEEWGVLLVTAGAAHLVRKAPPLEPKPTDRPFLAALVRAAAKSGGAA